MLEDNCLGGSQQLRREDQHIVSCVHQGCCCRGPGAYSHPAVGGTSHGKEKPLRYGRRFVKRTEQQGRADNGQRHPGGARKHRKEAATKEGLLERRAEQGAQDNQVPKPDWRH